MPIYEYRCPACNRITEEWVRNFDVSDDVPCEHCGKPAHRIMSHTSFLLKGGGWYVTEYGSHKGVPAETPAAPSTPAESSATTSAEPAAPAAGTPDSSTAPAAAATESAPQTETKATAA